MKKVLLFSLILLTLTLSACAPMDLSRDGQYSAEVALSGGSGRASLDSPAEITITDGVMTARITWSSPYYDFVLVDGVKYLPVNTSGNSVFEVPVTALDQDIVISAETTAMSQPHVIDYTLYFDSSTLKSIGGDTIVGIVIIAAAVALTGAAVIFVMRRRKAEGDHER